MYLTYYDIHLTPNSSGVIYTIYRNSGGYPFINR